MVVKQQAHQPPFGGASMTIDLNCDLGEGAGFDAEIIPLITSANVSCGAHAGTPADILRTLELCKQHGVTVGAHPGHADREHFGRRELPVTAQEVAALLRGQIGDLRQWAAAAGVAVRYVKPHGGLYHQANRDAPAAGAMLAVGGELSLPVVGLPGSRLQALAGHDGGVITEGFADRRYQADGSLVPRDQPNAMIDDPKEAVAQVLWLLDRGQVRTVCVHGDTPRAVAFVRAVREELLRRGVELKPFA